MDNKVKQFLHETFSDLETKYGFIIAEEYDDTSTYFIDYQSSNFTLELTAYHQEFSIALLKTDIDEAVALFNLLDYLGYDTANRNFSELFKGEKIFKERYKGQLRILADTIYANIDLINQFFSRVDLKEKFSEITRFMINKYPDLFKTS